MIELKVVCDCGQKYKFDVEPVHNRMPFTVTCPICHRDGTATANQLLQQMAIFKPVESPPAPAAVSASAPPPIAPVASAPPPLPAGAARLRVNVPVAGEPGAAPPPIGARPRLGAAAPVAVDQAKKPPSFALGLLGGFAGALVGAILYYVIYKFTGIRIGYMAIGAGALAGWAANFLGRGEGSKELGGITAVLVVAGIVGAQYIVALERWHHIEAAYQDAGYTDSIKEAKEVVRVVPTGAEGEIRMYLAKQNADEGEAIKPAAVADEDVKAFREKQLPQYQELASGKVTKEQYLARMGIDSDKMKKFQDEEEGTFKAVFLLILFSRVGIISLIAGAGLAYKLSANA